MRLFEHSNSLFSTSYIEILNRIRSIEPVKYGKTRNYINGAVSYLSPYISRGIISTKFIMNEVLQSGYNPAQIEKFIQELAWRDYWQQIWIAKGDDINRDLKNTQKPVSNNGIPKSIVESTTGILAIDKAIHDFYENGYLHNHLRMYIASIACNVGQSHWLHPAKWMYYHLLDADWASNALSWQWVAGANANKKYIANQENINKYCLTNQKGTFLDISYEELATLEIPNILMDTAVLELTTALPLSRSIVADLSKPTFLYNFYNLDPTWKNDISANRILLLEPSHFEKYPVSNKSIDFILEFSEKNIENVQVFVGEFNELVSTHKLKNICYKEHPTNLHYQGTEEPRDWMFDEKGFYRSFFAFWKKCKKQLRY